MRRVTKGAEIPEMVRYTKYYEHDGMLRAYANRTTVLAMAFAVLAIGSFAFAIYVRLQPPTVVRVDKDGNASVLGAVRAVPIQNLSLFDQSDSGPGPTDLEARALVRRFLERYLSHTPESVDRNLAEALNMMTTNLRAFSMNRLRDEDTVGKIRGDNIISDFQIRSIELVQGTPWTYIVFGVKEVHRVKDGREVTDRIVARYNVRLVTSTRSESNPSGLLVAEYGEQQMVGDREAGLLQQSALDKERR